MPRGQFRSPPAGVLSNRKSVAYLSVEGGVLTGLLASGPHRAPAPLASDWVLGVSPDSRLRAAHGTDRPATFAAGIR